jgi:hypothetical protein
MAQDMNREETLDRLEEKAGDYEELFGSCSHGSFPSPGKRRFIGRVSSLPKFFSALATKV